MTGTVQIHRVLRTTQDKVYKAVLDADAMCYLGWQESMLQLANLVEPQILG